MFFLVGVLVSTRSHIRSLRRHLEGSRFVEVLSDLQFSITSPFPLEKVHLNDLTTIRAHFYVHVLAFPTSVSMSKAQSGDARVYPSPSHIEPSSQGSLAVRINPIRSNDENFFTTSNLKKQGSSVKLDFPDLFSNIHLDMRTFPGNSQGRKPSRQDETCICFLNSHSLRVRLTSQICIQLGSSGQLLPLQDRAARHFLEDDGPQCKQRRVTTNVATCVSSCRWITSGYQCPEVSLTSYLA